MGSAIRATATVANGILYVAAMTTLYAIEQTRSRFSAVKMRLPFAMPGAIPNRKVH